MSSLTGGLGLAAYSPSPVFATPLALPCAGVLA